MGREEGRRGRWGEAVRETARIKAGSGRCQGRPPQPTTCPVAVGSPGLLDDNAGPGTVRWPASGMQALPPLALGGMGGGALSGLKCLVY
jgi:hypothetical protein